MTIPIDTRLLAATPRAKAIGNTPNTGARLVENDSLRVPAAMESFFATLKTELICGEQFKTQEEAKARIFEYIEMFYNPKRRHSSLGLKNPFDFERINNLKYYPHNSRPLYSYN
jgi:hypothetical protein